MEDLSYNQQLVDGRRAETYNRDVMYHNFLLNYIKIYIYLVFLVVAPGIISSAS